MKLEELGFLGTNKTNRPMSALEAAYEQAKIIEGFGSYVYISTVWDVLGGPLAELLHDLMILSRRGVVVLAMGDQSLATPAELLASIDIDDATGDYTLTSVKFN